MSTGTPATTQSRPDSQPQDDFDVEVGTPDDGQDSGEPSPTQEDGLAANSQPQKPIIPMQKRRRVTRACDECRRKKIKCDGKQPCTHCTVYSYECTYDQPSNRRRNPAPQYIEALENQLRRAKAILNVVLPTIDLNDANLDNDLPANVLAMRTSGARTGQPSSRLPQKNPPIDADDGKDARLESMVRATGQLDLDEEGHWDYHGHSSGLSFVRRMREQLGDLPEGHATPFVKSRPMSQVFDSPKSMSYSEDSPYEMGSSMAELPPKEKAKELVGYALDDATSILIIVHRPSFNKMFDRIYNLQPENYGNEENKFLPLLYAVMALGSLFGKDEASELSRFGYEHAIERGFKYFKASRQLLDIADCREISSVQAVIFMILFLQSSAKLSTCYSYIGIALRSAIRMGLHRRFSDNFNPVESETRKRVFWVIRKMDIYVGALLGLPQTLNDEDIDQEYPAEVDDELITEDGILPMPEGKISMTHAACNAHTDICLILTKIVRYIYPIKGTDVSKPYANKSYSVSISKVKEIEGDLQRWMENLPMALKPGGEEQGSNVQRCQQLLRIAYAHSQTLLYRPFLHYVSRNCTVLLDNKRAYACAAACVSVSRNVIHIAAEMKKRGLLNGAYWFTMYTTFFAILSLVYFALENPDNPTSDAVLRDALQGKEILQQLAKRSMAADRCSATLVALFEQLPDRLKRVRTGQQMMKTHKRQAPSPTITPRSLPDNPDPIPPVRRAATFPPKPRDNIVYTVPHTNMQQDLYSGSNTPSAMMTPDSLSSPMLASNRSYTGLPFTLGGDYQDPSLPDLSAMMFPSTDPFAYPNPPMTTFENNLFSQSQHQNQNPNPNNRFFQQRQSNIFIPQPSPNQGNGAENDSLDAQLLGTYPPFMSPNPGSIPSAMAMLPPQQQFQQPQNMNLMGLASAENMIGNGMMMPPSADWPGTAMLDGDGGGVAGNGMGGGGQAGVDVGLQGMGFEDLFNGDDWGRMLGSSGMQGMQNGIGFR